VAYTIEFYPSCDKRSWSAYEDPMVLPPTARRAPERPKFTILKALWMKCKLHEQIGAANAEFNVIRGVTVL